MGDLIKLHNKLEKDNVGITEVRKNAWYCNSLKVHLPVAIYLSYTLHKKIKKNTKGSLYPGNYFYLSIGHVTHMGSRSIFEHFIFSKMLSGLLEPRASQIIRQRIHGETWSEFWVNINPENMCFWITDKKFCTTWDFER